MRTRALAVVAAAAAALLAAPASAVDAPHDGSFTEGLCQTCHKLHASSGGTLTNQPDNNTTCTACHNSKVGSRRGFPWQSSQQASPGVGGNQHSWTGYAVNPGMGAATPLDSEMAVRLASGTLQCSTCHDQHAANKANAPGAAKTSIAVGTPVDENGNLQGPRGLGQLTLLQPGAAALPKGYRLKVQTVTAGVGGTFIISHDFGLSTPTWFNWNGSAWVAGASTGPGRSFSINTNVATDDPAVQVRFSDGAFAGDYWDFSVTFPFLRASNVNDAMCQDCHRDRVMDHACVEGQGACAADGLRSYSHPVNQVLNANARNYDRTPANPDPSSRALLDADGSDQSTGDGITTNDLVLVAGPDLVKGTADDGVGCTTCHAPHNADSNSLTEDPR